MRSAVPQGSHCGPLLLNFVIINIDKALTNSQFQVFANDVKILGNKSNRKVKTFFDKNFKFYLKKYVDKVLVLYPDSGASSNNYIYSIPCECGDLYVVQTKRRLEVRIKEYKAATQRYEVFKSDVATFRQIKSNWKVVQNRIFFDKFSLKIMSIQF